MENSCNCNKIYYNYGIIKCQSDIIKAANSYIYKPQNNGTLEI